MWFATCSCREPIGVSGSCASPLSSPFSPLSSPRPRSRLVAMAAAASSSLGGGGGVQCWRAHSLRARRLSRVSLMPCFTCVHVWPVCACVHGWVCRWVERNTLLSCVEWNTIAITRAMCWCVEGNTRAINGWTAATSAQKARHNNIYSYLCKVASGRISLHRMRRAQVFHRMRPTPPGPARPLPRCHPPAPLRAVRLKVRTSVGEAHERE